MKKTTLIQKAASFGVRNTPEFLKPIIKKLYDPDDILPCKYGESLTELGRIKEMQDLLAKTINLNGDVIEIGVFRGGGLISLAEYLRQNKINKMIFGVDTFEGHPYSDENDIASDGKVYHYKGRYTNTNINKVYEAVTKRNLSKVFLVKGTVSNFKFKNKFCFAHLDVDTYRSCIEGLQFLLPRMVKGGIILNDDYNLYSTPGATKAMNELVGKTKVIMTGKQGGYYIKE